MFRPAVEGEPFSFPFQCIFLKIFGVWPVEDVQVLASSPRRRVLWRRLYKVHSAVVIFLIFITCSFQSFFVFSKWGELLIVTECGCTVFMGIHNLLRCVHLNQKRDAMRALMQEFLKKIYVTR